MIICNTNRKKLFHLFLEAIIPIFVGGLIYILFRTDSLLMFRWFESFNLSSYVNTLRDSANLVNADYFKTLINTLPGGLWVLSYTSFLLVIWKNEINSRNIFYFIFIPLIAVMSEFLQLFGIVSGTFDILDIISYATGTILPFIIHYHKIKINVI